MMNHHGSKDPIHKAFACNKFLQESLVELTRCNETVPLHHNKDPNVEVIETYNIDVVDGHLLTGFSAMKTGESLSASSVWAATLYIGPRMISNVPMELGAKKTYIPFFSGDSPLLLPLFLLDRWPVKIQLHRMRESGAFDGPPRVFMHTKWLTRSSRKRLRSHPELQITYRPTDSIAMHRLRLVQQ